MVSRGASRQEVKWPDWRGETAIIVATGPSAAEADLIGVKGKARVIVIKSSWRLAPWADVLYGCDRAWWIANRGAVGFKGQRITASPTVSKIYPGILAIELVNRAEIITGKTGRIGCGLRTGGGHSGFHAINLAVQFGAKRIVLVGLDMNLHRGRHHWHPEEDRMWRNRTDQNMAECRSALDACAPQFEKLGVEVINASPASALKAYRKADLMDAIAA